MMAVLLGSLLSMGRCDRLSVCLGNLLNTLNSPRLGTNLLHLAILLPLNTARRVQVFLRAWGSTLPPTATHTTVPVVTAAVILNRHTVRIRKCISSKVISRTLKTYDLIKSEMNTPLKPFQQGM